MTDRPTHDPAHVAPSDPSPGTTAPHSVAIVVPRVNSVLQFPEEYHSTVVMDMTNRETQAASLGEGMLRAYELAATHPNYERLTENLHYVVLFAQVDSLED